MTVEDRTELDPELYAEAQRRMCEIIQARGPATWEAGVIGSEVWLSYLTPECCQPGVIFQVPEEPWWVHWQCWTPAGSRTGLADDKAQAVRIIQTLWSDWM